MAEEMDKFLKFLKYQINQKNRFENVVRKIPLFKNDLQDCHYTIVKMIDIRRREIYNMLVEEFNKLMIQK